MPTTLIYNFPEGPGFVTVCSNEIVCPGCGTKRNVSSSFESKKRPKHDLWKCKCKGCGLLLGFTYDMRGDAVCWDKKKADIEVKRLEALPQPTEVETAAFLAALPDCDPEAECRAYLAELETKHNTKNLS